MKRLHKNKTKQMVDGMRQAALSPRTWDVWYDENGSMDAIVHFAGGEVFNVGIEGYLYAWKMMGRIEIEKLTNKNKTGIAAQGLEGMIRVETSLPTALNVFDILPPNRCFIEV